MRRPVATVIDFETTGAVAGHPNEPWQMGLAEFEDDRLGPGTLRESLIRVGERPFSPQAARWLSVPRAQLAEAPAFRELWPVFKDRLAGRVLVAHHAATERKILRTLAPMHRLGPWVDTLALARRAHPGLTSYALEDLAVTLRLRDRITAHLSGRSPHDALYDAVACGVLLEHLLALPGWSDLDWNALARVR